MRINFDHLSHNSRSPVSHTSNKTIEVEVQSPFYERIVKPISPRNYKKELSEIKYEMTMPDSITKFLEKEVEHEFREEKEDVGRNAPIDMMDKVKQLEYQIKTKKQVKEEKKVHRKINWVFNYKKHKCNNHISRKLENQLNDKQQTTLQPKLVESKVGKKLWGKKLQSYAKCSSKRYSVYEHLYMETKRRQMKKEMKDQESSHVPEEKKDKKRQKHEKYVSIYNRLDQLVKQKEVKKKEKVAHDLTTGRQYFKPDLISSKCSYKYFTQSLSKSKLSFTKYSIEKDVQKSQVGKKVAVREKGQINYLDEKVIECLVAELCPQNRLNLLALKKYGKEEVSILKPFLHNIEELEAQVNDQQTTISSKKDEKGTEKGTLEQSMFKNKLLKFYKSLNLYDRQTLRNRFINKREKNRDDKEHRYHPLVNVRSSSLDSLSKGHQKQVLYV